MSIVANLKGHELNARGCGNCSGSKSDNKIRAKRDDDRSDSSPEQITA